MGIVCLGLILVFTLSGTDLGLFLNAHSIILVLGGTLGVFLVCTPPAEVVSAIGTILSQLRPQVSSALVNEQLLTINKRRSASLSKPHALIAYAQELWEKGVDDEMFEALLVKRLHETNNGNVRVVTSLRNLAKYPPALGMTGTVFGLVALFSNLTVDSKEALGPSLATAMTATFYGLVAANMIFMPLADRCHVWQLASSELNQYIVKIVLMIHQNDGESIVADEVKVHAA